MRAQLNRLLVVTTLVVVLPLVAILGRVRPRGARRLTVYAIRCLARLCGVRIDVHRTARLDDLRSCVLIPNHTSPLDIAAVLMACPDAQFVASAELFRIPLLGSAMRALDTVPIRRDDRSSARSRVEELAQHDGARDLVMFPEGRIAPDREVLPFKTGAFVIAIGRGAPVVPVAISGAAVALPPRGRLLVRPGRIHVELLDPLPTIGLDRADRHPLADRARQAIVRELRVVEPVPAAR